MNENIIAILEKAIQEHLDWVKRLKQIIEREKDGR